MRRIGVAHPAGGPGYTAAIAEVRDPFIGTLLDRRYRIEERIAAGGFGAIYRAVHVRSEMQLAIKVLHPRLSADERIVARFRREGATLTSLRSPHTVTTYELAEDANGTLFIVMELLVGQTLLERFQSSGALPWRRVVAIARAVCDALAEAHALGVVHRDLKPANIHLSRRGGDDQFVKVLDFGIAKLLRGSGIEEGAEELTNHNEVIGTFEYISPEQIAGDSYSGRSDIYTLGIVMYELVTGSRPFGNLTGPALMATIFSDVAKPPSTRMPGLPAGFDAMVLRCLERDPDARYADVHELAAALDELLLAERDDTGESQTSVGAMLDPRIVLGDESTSIATRGLWRGAADSVQTQTVVKPGVEPEGPTAPDPSAPPLELDTSESLITPLDDATGERVTPVDRDSSPIHDSGPQVTPPLERTEPRPLPVLGPRPPSGQPAYPAAAGSLGPLPLPAFGGDAPVRPHAPLPPPRSAGLAGPREGIGSTAPGMGIGPGLPRPSMAKLPVRPEPLANVFSTLEGWQAPTPPGGLVLPDPRKAAADRERRILIWAAVLGVAILIGVILAVSV